MSKTLNGKLNSKKVKKGYNTTEIPSSRFGQNSPMNIYAKTNIVAHNLTKKIITSLDYWKTLNPSLRFNRYLKTIRHKGKIKFDYSATIYRRRGVHEECIRVPNEINKRIKHLWDVLESQNRYLIKTWSAQTSWRMVIGLGTPHVHETTMTWHHTWSLPYIPGSALKGVTRSYYITKLWEEFSSAYPKESWENTVPCLEAFLMDEPHPSKKHNEKDCPVLKWVKDAPPFTLKMFPLIFGTKNHKGSVIFLDAYPADRYCIKLDVINVHYPEYYQNKENKAADWESPNPVFFLTIVNTTFNSLLLLNKPLLMNAKKNIDLSPQDVLNTTIEYLKEALSIHGVGAKTMVGYGILMLID